MTQKVNPSSNRAAEAFKTAGTIANAEGEGYVVGQDSQTDIVIQDADLIEDNMSEFSQESQSDSFGVNIQAGEAFVYGAWLAIDRQTAVGLNESENNQEVFVGWNKDGANDVVIGKESAFSTSVNNSDPKIKIWEFDTDANGVTAVRDHRKIGRAVDTSYSEGKTTVGRNDTFSVFDDSGEPSGPWGDTDVFTRGTLSVGGSFDDGENNQMVVSADESDTYVYSRIWPSGEGQVRINSDYMSRFVMANIDGQSMEGDELGRVVYQSLTPGGSERSVLRIKGVMEEDQPSDGMGDARLEMEAPVRTIHNPGFPSYTESLSMGHGRYFGSVDAEYDKDTGVWLSRSSQDMPHAGIGFVNHNPGEGTSTGNIAFAAAPKTTSEGELISWREMTFTDTGTLRMKDGGIEFTGVQTPPTPPSTPGWIIYTDEEDGRLKARDTDGNITTLASQ